VRETNLTRVASFQYPTSTLLKRLMLFPSPAGMSLTWPEINKLFLARESLVRDIAAGDGKIDNLFYSVRVWQLANDSRFHKIKI
jgi:hypothetical protein